MSELFWRAYLECDDSHERTKKMIPLLRVLVNHLKTYDQMARDGTMSLEQTETHAAGLLNSYFEDFHHSIERKARREKGANKN